MVKITDELRAEILRLFHAEQWRVGTISAEKGLHHSSVRRALGLERAQPAAVRAPRSSALDAYKAFILKTLKDHPRLRATRIYDMIRARGYAGSPRMVREHVATVRPREAAPQAFLHIETLPGEQAQVDWAHVGKLHVPGGTRDLWMFVMVLSHSRATFAEFVIDLSVYSLLRSLVRASAVLGGVPRTWLFDNPKVVVLQRSGSAAQFHPLLLDLCGKLRVQPRLCEVRMPHHKGKVERSIRYLRDRFLSGRTIASVESGNSQVAEFITEIAHERPHPELRVESVSTVFSREQKTLMTLPDPVPITDLVLPCTVDAQAFVHFDSNRYSTPPDLAGRKDVTLRVDDQWLRVLADGETHAEHRRCFARHQRIEHPGHRAQLVRRRARARPTKEQDRLREAAPHIQRIFEAWVTDGINIGFATIRVGHLLDLYGQTVFALAVEDLLTRKSHDVSALALRCEVHRRALGKPVPSSPPQFATHVQDGPVRQHRLQDYDDE